MSFTVYRSSAGSGKTYTLVKEYLKIALSDVKNPPKRYKEILAITFTNKAAAEMKERVITALKELATKDSKAISAGTSMLLEILKKETALSEITLKERAANVLESILHHYSDFAIGTIDSFVHKVVRTFAFDLKIPMNFDIELDADKLLAQAIDLLISRIGNDERLTKALVDFSEYKTDGERSWQIEDDLRNFAHNLLKEEGLVYLDKLKNLNMDHFFEIQKRIDVELKKFESSINKIGKEALELITESGIDHDRFAGGQNGIAKYFYYLAESRMDKLIPTPTIRKYVNEDKWYASKATESDKAMIDACKGRLTALYDTAWDYIQENLQEFKIFYLINKNIYPLALLNEIEKILKEFKSQNNVLHISEFNKLISNIVVSQPVPFIYERLGEKYHNFLIDEFQDTSVLQWQNLLPLIDNSLSENNFNMLVGDGKQAIYRWRGGEVEQFSKLPQVIHQQGNEFAMEREKNLIRHYDPKQLNKNYRSKIEIIQFNNSFFRALSNKLNEHYQSIYDGLEQEFNSENKGGYVSVDFLEGDQEEFAQNNLNKIFEIIQESSRNNFQLKHIAILVRVKEDGNRIANFLTEKKIEVISNESLLLKNSREVNFIHACLKYLQNQQDDIAKVEMLEFLLKSKWIREGNLHENITKLVPTGTTFFNLLKANGFEFISSRLVKLPLYEMGEELIRIFGLNKNPDLCIQFFLDEMLDFSVKNTNHLGDFLIWWEQRRKKASVILPEGINAVSIMTIHASKGLEFPLVIIPFANGGIRNGKKNLWIDLANEKIAALPSALVPMVKDLEETEYEPLYQEEKNKSLLDTLNVLYVALTRAEERLYILTGKPGKDAENISTISDLFSYYYRTKNEWSETVTQYINGHKEAFIEKKSDSLKKSYHLLSFHSENWRDKIKIRTNASSIWNTEDLEKEKDWEY